MRHSIHHELEHSSKHTVVFMLSSKKAVQALNIVMIQLPFTAMLINKHNHYLLYDTEMKQK